MSTAVHLHAHSFFSLLGATPSPEALAAQAAAEGMTHLALTDTDALYGVVTFDRACRAVGVQPIIGMTVAVAWPDDLLSPPGTGGPGGDTGHEPGHLVLLARDPSGYRSLCELSSLIQGARDRERRAGQGLSLSDLRTHATGLICLTGGRRDFAYRCLASGKDQLAHRYIGKLCGIYEPEHTFVGLELQPNARGGGTQDAAVASELTRKAEFLGLATVALQPIYAMEPGERSRLRLLAAIRANCRLEAVPSEALPDQGDPGVAVHWPSPDAMGERFAAFPAALANTNLVAALCTSDAQSVLPTGKLMWPSLNLPQGQTPATALAGQATTGCLALYGTPLPKPVQERLVRELTAITVHGYDPLFLVVADVVGYAHQQDIPVSTRGSVANSLVAYGLGITTVDPIAHGLLFERFLNPGRADPPDIDLDFCSRRRDEVQEYVRRTYGADHVALVGAMSTLQLRSAAREAAKAFSLNDAETETVLAAVPERFYGPRHRDAPDVETAAASVADEKLKEVIRAAYGIAHFPHHLSIHACGMVITPGPLTDLVPVQMAPKGYLTTQYDHGDCEAVGLPKLDLLGIRALTVLADAAEEIRLRDPDFRLGRIPPDDPQTADALMRGDTIGCFQIDSVGARRTLRKLKARTIQDLAVANAFFKPGPATGGQADIFVRRYRGEAPTQYLHPALGSILAHTKGVLIFQEQVLEVATQIAGLSWTEADHIRRGMSKMRPAEMRQLETAFVAGCQRPGGPGLSHQQAEQLWQQISAFSGYGFNQGHATAYADVSYRSAYIRVHFPAEFFFARLRNFGGYHHPAVYMAEAIRLGIDVRIPHVNHSFASVVLKWEMAPTLWLGLQLVRDLRRQAIAGIVRARRDGPFADLRDLLVRVDLQDKEIIHLIQAGALDGLGANRPSMLAEAETLARAGTARQMAFDFAAGYAPPASRAQHLAWERRLVGYPLNALNAWLAELRTEAPHTTPLQRLGRSRGNTAIVGVRLPGWHRGGYAIWDGESWEWTETDPGQKAPPSWDPAIFHGSWQSDRWGMGRFVVQRWQTAVP
ncbi:MAG: DNA polymerase III subunit alpha [Anaerolineae bacterium]|nr:DNA polymerase III subunit alpha [Anaerolineae bacterium]